MDLLLPNIPDLAGGHLREIPGNNGATCTQANKHGVPCRDLCSRHLIRKAEFSRTRHLPQLYADLSAIGMDKAERASNRRNDMSIKNICSKLVIVAGVIAALLISSNPSAFAKTVTVKGSGQGASLTSAFSFDGVRPAGSIVSTGKDNLGGTFNEPGCRRICFYRNELYGA
jgi:hypothetical protein